MRILADENLMLWSQSEAALPKLLFVPIPINVGTALANPIEVPTNEKLIHDCVVSVSHCYQARLETMFVSHFYYGF